jgi:surface carbohydrate biosynthesis protein (TIGR04326 family)
LNKIVVWDTAEKPIGSGNPNVEFMFWRSYGQVGFDNACYIPRWIEENSDLLRAKYLAWIYEFGQQPIKGKNLIDTLEIRLNFSYWWMTPLVEKCNFAKSPQISDVIRLYAVDALMEGRTNCVVELFSSNRKLVSCMQVWCNAKGFGFLWRNLETDCKKRPFLRRFYNALTHSMHLVI